MIIAGITCRDCGAECPIPPPEGGASGYAIRTTDGAKICYACADKGERAAMAKRNSYPVYLSGDSKHVTTWTGGILGVVTQARSMRLFGRVRKISIRVLAFDGSIWYARGADNGMVCTLRRAKS